jgi:3-oxoacyl-[acyl-carrier protein] reductase
MSWYHGHMERGTGLSGKVALVTGGGTGIGREIALAYAALGADVAVNYSRSRADAERTARDVQALGPRGRAVQADVSRDAEVRAMLLEVETSFGGLDILVNNAATTRFIAFEDMEGVTDETWDNIFAVNVRGVFWVTRAAVPLLRRRGGGVIVNMASVAGITGSGSSIPYCASKAAVIAMTRSFAKTLAPAIRVNAVAPGFVDTRWTEGQEESRKRNAQLTPLGRVAVPEDVAEIVVSLTTGGRFVTGQVVVVDGGRTL